MKASRLIQILAEHMNDRDGGDFEVYVYQGDRRSNMVLAECTKPVERCWLYPGVHQIIIASE